eukprot:jgi/Ulvmu1/9767/UM056_0007.1
MSQLQVRGLQAARSEQPLTTVRDAEPGSVTRPDLPCQAILRHFGSRRRTDNFLPNDVSITDKREREHMWQHVHQLCWVGSHKLVGHFFYVCPCGVIMGSFPMEALENFQDNLKFLDTKLFPDVSEHITDILVYDRACQVHRAVKFKNSLNN